MNSETTATLRPVAESAGLARSLVERTLRAWDCVELVEDALIVASELVANVVRHARTEARLNIRRDPSSIRIAVFDTSPRPAVVREVRDPMIGDGGRGLVIVRELSSRWGVDHHDGGKTVWADLRDPRLSRPSGVSSSVADREHVDEPGDLEDAADGVL